MDSLIETLFIEALEIDDLSERNRWLDRQIAARADGQDAGTVRQRVQQMLAADAEAGSFLGQQLFGPDPSNGESATGDPATGGAATGGAGDREFLAGDRFEILGSHRHGGLGEVLVALDHQLGREVALKRIKPDWRLHEEARERFVREAEVTGRLEHPGVVPVYAMGKWSDGSHYYVMRFVEGRTLGEVIDQERSGADQLSLRRLLGHFVDVCNTISYAHGRGILHRDIKPANVMIGPYGETLVVDWGLAKRLDDSPINSPAFDAELSLKVESSNGQRRSSDGDSSATRAGGRVGSPQYMSPEQAAGKIDSIDVRTDVYLLGATLFQILTGEPPHQGDSVAALLENIQNNDVVTNPRSLDGSVPPPLGSICVRAMARQPSDRYASSSALAADVEAWLGDQRVAAHVDRPSERIARWLRRHRTFATSALVALVLLAFGSLLGTTFYNARQNEKRRLEEERSLRRAEVFVQKEKAAADLRQRMAEMETLAQRADSFSLREMRDDRFDSALGIVNDAVSALAGQNVAPDLLSQLSARQQQLRMIVDFYTQAELCEQKNILSRDIHAMVAAVAALRSLGVYDKPDWWAHLPIENLSPIQIDRLRWEVYQQWMLLDAMLLKNVGMKLSGTDTLGSTSSLFQSLRRFRSTDLGKPEAASTIAVADRLDAFRPAEAVRWYRKGGEFRLGWGDRLQGEDLGEPRNEVDAQCLGVLCLIAHLDPKFEIFFRDYREGSPLENALDLFGQSSSLRPNHYWTQICLAQSHYLAAIKPDVSPEISRRHFEAASRACERCIAIRPDQPFAYADRSMISRALAKSILADETKSPTRRVEIARSLHELSLNDSQNADRLGDGQPWIGWPAGLALLEAGRPDVAMQRWWRAAIESFSIVQTDKAALVRDDDLRGRGEVADWLAERLWASDPSFSGDVDRLALLAAIRISQNRWQDAASLIDSMDGDQSLSPRIALVKIAMMIHRKQFSDAAKRIQHYVTDDPPTRSMLTFFAARCDEELRNYQAAQDAYRRGLDDSSILEHRAAFWLGMARCNALMGQTQIANDALQKAIDLEPAIDIKRELIPVGLVYRALQNNESQNHESITQDDPPMPMPLDDYRARLYDFIAASVKLSNQPIVDLTIPWQTDPPPPDVAGASLLDNGFEMRGPRYWGTWRHEVQHSSAADERAVPTSDARWSDRHWHAGRSSLRIVGHDHTKIGTGAKRGELTQTFPIASSVLYRVSVWCRGSNAVDGAVEIRMNDQAVIKTPPGTSDWQQIEGLFEIAGTSTNSQRFIPVTMSIQCRGSGTVWLDDVDVSAVPALKNDNPGDAKEKR